MAKKISYLSRLWIETKASFAGKSQSISDFFRFKSAVFFNTNDPIQRQLRIAFVQAYSNDDLATREFKALFIGNNVNVESLLLSGKNKTRFINIFHLISVLVLGFKGILIGLIDKLDRAIKYPPGYFGRGENSLFAVMVKLLIEFLYSFVDVPVYLISSKLVGNFCDFFLDRISDLVRWVENNKGVELYSNGDSPVITATASNSSQEAAIPKMEIPAKTVISPVSQPVSRNCEKKLNHARKRTEFILGRADSAMVAPRSQTLFQPRSVVDSREGINAVAVVHKDTQRLVSF